MRALLHIAHIVRSRGLTLLLMALFVCASLHASAQVNPFARERRSARTIIRSGQIYTPDSLEVRRADSIRIAKLADTLRKISPDSLAKVGEDVRKQLPDSLRTQIFGALRDSLAVDSLAKDSLTERQRKRLEKRENRTPFIKQPMRAKPWKSGAKSAALSI